jgi:hypothetical protein
VVAVAAKNGAGFGIALQTVGQMIFLFTNGQAGII